MDSPTPQAAAQLAAGAISADLYRAALAKAVALLMESEFQGNCSDNGDCHLCAWESDRDALIDKWRHLLR